MESGDLRVNNQRGFTYLVVLFSVAFICVGLSVTATVWTKEAERQREAEAEWVLAQYKRAVRSYYNAAPGSIQTLPDSLDELLVDRRHLGLVRHLRKIYRVPCDSADQNIANHHPSSIEDIQSSPCLFGDAGLHR